MKTDESHEKHKPLAQDMSLSAFVEKNLSLLTILGIFTALTVFAAELPLQPLGSMLSFLFMAETVILWSVLLEHLPSKGKGWRMLWFENIMTLSVIILVFYWLLAYRELWREWLIIPLAAILLASVSWVLKHFDIFNRVFRAKPDEKRALRWIFWMVILAAVFTAAAVISEPLNNLLDTIAGSFSDAQP